MLKGVRFRSIVNTMVVDYGPKVMAYGSACTVYHIVSVRKSCLRLHWKESPHSLFAYACSSPASVDIQFMDFPSTFSTFSVTTANYSPTVKILLTRRDSVSSRLSLEKVC